jgi:glyoxylase-like metal-dependent hydrolase (beta-lactamase superfamily II)
VVDTHLHHDHVGWNTRLEVDTWAPTFPHATYLLPRADHDYFAAADATFFRLLIADSIEPVANAGRLRLWQDGPRIDDTLRRSRRGRREARTGTGHLRHRALGGPVTPVRG